MKDQANIYPEVKQSPWLLRNMIALVITVPVIGVTIFIAVYMLIHHTYSENGSIDMTFIGQTLLPLWGTWLGTVLAFYFGKANFEAASKSYQDVIKNMTPDEKIAKLLVKDVMIKDIKYLDYDTQKSVSIEDILANPDFVKYNRYAVLDKNKAVKCMIHKSLFLEFLFYKKFPVQNTSATDATAIPPDANAVITLDSLLTSNIQKFTDLLKRGYGFVSLEASLLDAKRIIDSLAECQDVFVTQTGSPTEAVLGLVTNTLIFEKAKV